MASQMIPNLPKSTKTAYGDSAYDKRAFYRSSYVQGIDPLVPPRREERFKAKSQTSRERKK
ncbi:hypothetical protein NEOC84_000100|nr:hypothetical protein [Neochlamydia sp. AcF84]